MSDPRLDPSPAEALKGGAHTCPADADHDREVPEIDLLSPLTIRGRDLPQPDRDVADVPVLRRRGAGQRLAPRPPRQPGGRRGRRW